MYRRSIVKVIVALLGLCGVASQAWAVKAELWTHEQPKEFTSAELKNLVVTSTGEVMLARKSDTLYVTGEEAEVINALARAGDGKIYAATGPKGIIYCIDDDKVTQFATCPDAGTIFSLLFTEDGNLLAGTGGGERAKIYLIDGAGQVTLFYEPTDARYVWAMARGPQGEIYAATGVEGKLFVIDADGSNGKMLADLKPNNLLCLAFGPDGMLYAGTDEDGLVYRINPASGTSYVLYDAKEPEISSIVLDKDGNVFAATAAADAARPGRTIADAPGGRPDHADSKTATSQPATGTNPGGGASESEGNGNDDDGEDKPGKEEKPARPVIKMPRRLGRAVADTQKAAGGNAIYRIDIDGFVTEVFRETVMILAMAERAGTIYVATGNEGRVYSITPRTEKVVVLAKLESLQVTAILRLPDGDLILGTANEAKLLQMSNDYAGEGTLVSKPLDAKQIVKWGRIKWEAKVPEGTKLSVATRSGNVEDTESDAWEVWSGEMDATAAQQVSSAGARFLQYRLTFETTVPDASPTLQKISIARIEENRPPNISALQVVSVSQAAKDPKCPPKVKGLAGRFGGKSKTPPPDYAWIIHWEAKDPNKDDLEYKVFYRALGNARWIRMAKELKDPFHIWDTRTVPDGKYEVRVVARDNKTNPAGLDLSTARISDSMTIDNTAPQVTIGAVAVEGKDRLTVNASITDAATPIEEASYTVDSSDEWIPLAALDDIFDSLTELVSFTIDDLEPGEHLIALRVIDRQGNTRYVTQTATISD